MRKRKQQKSFDSQVNIQPQLLQPRPFETQPQTEQAADLQTLQKKAQQPGFNFTDISIFAPNQTSKSIPIQPKLNLGQPNDKYEQEADRVAAQVVQSINSPQANQPVQRTEREEDEQLQMKPWLNLQARAETADTNAVPAHIEQDINRAKGGGQNLTPNLQQKMGNAMGADFSSVKVHTDSNANRLNQSIQAKAFTTGNNIFFKQGEYNPSSKPGQQLIAHELTHVVQQNGVPESSIQRDAINPRDEDGNRLPITHPESAIGGPIGEPQADENVRNRQVEHLLRYATAAANNFKKMIEDIINAANTECGVDNTVTKDDSTPEYCWNLDTNFKYVTKELKSAREKAEKLQSYDPREGVEFMVDVLRGTIVCQNDGIVKKVQEVIEEIAEKIWNDRSPEFPEGNFYSFRRDGFNKADLLEWQSPGLMKGYGDVKYFLPVIFNMGGNSATIRCEIQIHNKQLTEIKDQKGGHRFYEIWRATKVGDNYRIIPTEELASAANEILRTRLDAVIKGVNQPSLMGLIDKLFRLSLGYEIQLDEQEYIGLELASDLLYREIRLKKQAAAFKGEPSDRFLKDTENRSQLADRDLSGADLRNAPLRGADLRGANLRNAHLRGADLSSANLKNANLSGADLRGANLRGVELRGVELRGFDLSGFDLRDADLRDADLRDADLSGANLSGSYLSGSYLRGANLSGANLRGVNLSGFDLSDVNLSGANLSGFDLSDVNLSGANLSVANLSTANLSGANLSGVKLSFANLSGAQLLSAKLRNTDLELAIVENAHFDHLSGISGSLKRVLISRGAIFAFTNSII